MSSESVPGTNQPTILVVEDNELVRLGMAATLTREGYLVLTASSGHDAMGILRQPDTSIAVVLLDVHLPDLSGVDLCGRLRKLYPNLPVIVCSGEATPDEMAELLRLGVRRYFQKPFTRDELLASVEGALP